MGNNRYAEKLKDPRWQKKRLEINNRDKWTCQKCGCSTQQLQVHHRHYITGREPWDYPNELLVTLCWKCHEEEEKFANSAQDILETMHFWGFYNIDIVRTLNCMINERVEEMKKNGQPFPILDKDKLPF